MRFVRGAIEVLAFGLAFGCWPGCVVGEGGPGASVGPLVGCDTDGGHDAGGTGACAGTSVFCDDFTNGALAASYATHNGTWARATGSYAVHDDVSWERARAVLAPDAADFDVTVHARSIGDAGFGLVYASQTDADGFAVIVHPAQFQGVYLKELGAAAAGADREIQHAALATPMPGAALALRVRRAGTTVTVWLGGTQLFAADDGGAGRHGRLGLLLSDTDMTGGGATFTLLRVDTESLASMPDAGHAADASAHDAAAAPDAGHDAGGTTPDASTGTPGALSGLPWNSGALAGNTGEISAWASYRNRPVDVAQTYTTRDSWTNIEGPDWLFNYFTGWNGQLVISQPMWPEGSGGSAEACATGAYDSQWRAFGSSLVAHGRADAVVRVGWEFNGNWFEWSCTNPPAWTACFQHIATAIRATDPHVVIDWTMNAHGSQSPASGNAYDCYPGDAYVDIVGIDSYDMYPPSATAAQFASQCNGPEGLCTLISFARTHHKRVGVGEWGIVTCNSGGGGDEPLYVQQMFNTFSAARDVLAYEAYFSNNASGVCSSLNAPDQAPMSSATYRSLFGR